MKALLVGLGIGVGLGVLFAPNTGARTRSKIRGKVNLWCDRLFQQVNDAKTTAASPADELSQGVSRGKALNRSSSKKPQATSFADSDLINTLSRDDLMTVNGIGSVLAERIISGRPYSSIRDLVDRRIIAQSTLEELQRQFGNRLNETA